MSKTNGYIRVPKFLAKADAELGVDLYFHLVANDTIVFYRGKGTRLTAKDAEKVEKMPYGSLLAPEGQRDELTKWMGHGVTQLLEVALVAPNEPLDSGQLKTTAVTLMAPLEEVTKDQFGDVTPDSKELLTDVSALVEQVVLQFKKSRSAKDYEELLRTSKGNALDPLQAHQRQVSALSVLILMSSGTATMDELSELGTAGLVHDLGLGEITLSIRDRHVVGMDGDLSAAEKLVHLRHTDLTLERLQARKIKLAPGAIKIIEQHHENWDGSGFKGTPGPEVCRPARALRIADDLVAWLSNIMNQGGLPAAYAELKQRGDRYDPELMESLGGSFTQS